MALSKESIKQLEFMSDGMHKGMTGPQARAYSYNTMKSNGYNMVKGKDGKRRWIKSNKSRTAGTAKRVRL